MRKIISFLALLVIAFALPQWAHAWNGYGLDGEDNSTWAGLTWNDSEKCLKGSFENWNGKNIRVQAYDNSKGWFGYKNSTLNITGDDSYDAGIVGGGNKFIISTNDKYDVTVYLENNTFGHSPNRIVFTKTNQVVDAPSTLYLYSSASSWGSYKASATPSGNTFTFSNVTVTNGEMVILSTKASTTNGYEGLKNDVYTHGSGDTDIVSGVGSTFSNTNAGTWKFTESGTYTIVVTWNANKTGTLTATKTVATPWDFSGKTRPSSVKAISVTGADATELTFNYDGTQVEYKWISPKFKATAASMAFKLELKDDEETLILGKDGKDTTGDLGSEVPCTTSDGNSGTYKEGNLTVGKYYQIEIAAVKDNMFKYKFVEVLPDPVTYPTLYMYDTTPNQIASATSDNGIYTFNYNFEASTMFLLSTTGGLTEWDGVNGLNNDRYSPSSDVDLPVSGNSFGKSDKNGKIWKVSADNLGNYTITVDWNAKKLTAVKTVVNPWDFRTNTKPTAVSIHLTEDNADHALAFSNGIWSGTFVIDSENGSNYIHYYINATDDAGNITKFGNSKGTGNLGAWSEKTSCNDVYNNSDSYQGGITAGKKYKVEVTADAANEYKVRFNELYTTLYLYSTDGPTQVGEATVDAEGKYVFNLHLDEGTSLVLCTQSGLTNWNDVNSNRYSPKNGNTDIPNADVPFIKFVSDQATPGAWQSTVAGDYTITVDWIAQTLTATCTAGPVTYPTLYMYRTDHYNVEQIYSATSDNGIYTFNCNFTADTWFVLSTTGDQTGWDGINPTRYSPTGSDVPLPVSGNQFGHTAGGDDSKAWKVEGEANYGNYTITVDWNAMTLTAVKKVAVPENVYLPLSSLDFEGGKKHYFLVGERQGEWHLQPEWEFTVVEDDVNGDKLVLENRFMYNGTFAVAVVDKYEDYVYHKYTYYGDNTVFNSTTLTSGNISGNATRYAVTKHADQILKHNTGKNVFWSDIDGKDQYWDGIGTLMSRIEVTLTDGVPQTVTMTKADAETTNQNRLFTLVGSKIFNQNYSLNSADGVKTTMQTREYSDFDGWQEGWIQYDRNTGKAYVDGNGEYLYHTSFTPDYMMNNPALFNMDVTGGEFSYSSQETQFVEWNKLPNLETDPYKSFYQAFSGKATIATSDTPKVQQASGTDMGYNFKVQVENTDQATTPSADWDCYVVRDMWIAGEFKFWTGWGGNTKKTYGDETGAAWHAMNGGPIIGEGKRQTVQGYDITSGTTATLYKNGQNIDDANYKIDGDAPVYFNRVVLWINNTDGVGSSFIQFIQESAGPAIQAQVATNTDAEPDKDNWIKYNWYLNAAQNDTDNNRKVVGYEITRYRMDNGVEVFDGYPEGGYVSVAEQNVKVSDLLQGSGTMPAWTTFTDKSAVSNLGFTPGLYRYKITITLDSEDGPTKTATSNQVAIYSDEAVTLQPMALQLVKLSEEGKKALDTNNEYLTYSPSNNATFYAMNLADETQTIDSKSVKVAFPTGTIDEIPGAKALKFLNENPDKYWWTSDYYVRCLDYDVYKAELQKQVNAGLIQAIPEPTVEMKETFGGDPIYRGVAKLLKHNGHYYYSLVMKRGGNVAQGTILTTLTYTTTNAGGSLHNYESKATLTIDPVLPQPYGLTYGYDYIRETVPVTYEGKQWAKVNVPSGYWNESASKTSKPVYVKLDGNFRPDRLDLNVKFNRPNVVEEIYNKYDIVYGVSLGVKGASSSDLSFTAVDKKTTDNGNPYAITVNGVRPNNEDKPVFNFATTTYEPNATAKADYSELGRNNGTFGAAPSIATKHTIRVNTGTGFAELYLGMIERNNSTWDWMYKGHKNFKDADDQLEGSTDTQCTTVLEAIKPLYYLVELKDGSSSKTTTYEYLVPHIANHHPGNTYDFHNSYKYLLNDSDPLIGTYVAKGFGENTPTLYATAMYLFEQKYEAKSEATEGEGYNTVTIDSPAATLRRVNTTPGANPAAGNFGDLPDTGVAPTEAVEDKTAAYVAVAGATYFMTPGDKMVTGVEDVLADGEGAEAVYYNLQGVRVDNPASAGVYIRVQGKNVSKVVVK